MQVKIEILTHLYKKNTTFLIASLPLRSLTYPPHTSLRFPSVTSLRFAMTDILQVSPLLKQYGLDVSNHQTSARLLKNILQRNIQQKKKMIKLVDDCPLVVKKHFGYPSSNKKYLHIIIKSEIEVDQQNLEIVENFIGGIRSHHDENGDDNSDNEEDIDKDYNRKRCVDEDDEDEEVGDNSEGGDEDECQPKKRYDDDNSEEGDDSEGVDNDNSEEEYDDRATIFNDYMDVDI